jgi:nicotinamidase-related amidase
MTWLHLAPASSPFILIDLQNRIVGPPFAPHSFSIVLENSNKVAAALRDKGATIVYVRVAIAEILHLPVDAPIRDPKAHPPPPDAPELIDTLDREPTDLVITKRHWGAFYGTELDQLLHRKRAPTLSHQHYSLNPTQLGGRHKHVIGFLRPSSLKVRAGFGE